MQMSHILHRKCNHSYPVAVRGEGCYIVDRQGKRYLDGCGGAAVSSLGHSHPAIKEALKTQIDQLSYVHSGFFTTEPMEQLATHLVEKAGENIHYAYFVSGGSEAVETSIKLARQYFLEQGKSSKSKLIARWQSYHGNTIGALSTGGNRLRREAFGPLLTTNITHISPCYAYRHKAVEESEENYSMRTANELEEAILKLGPDNVAAFIAEPVVGATMGCVPPTTGYFKRIREICDQYDILLILDEVMCGMGRTGSLFAYEQEAIHPDIVCIAKGLGAGYQPIGATLLTKQIHDTIAAGSGAFQHGHTYIGHALACSAALATVTTIEQEGLIEDINTQGDYLKSTLEHTFSNHPNIGDIRGRGLFIGLELVADPTTKAPLDPQAKIHQKIKTAAMNNGLMCYPMGGTIDGKQGEHILLAPPYIISNSEIDQLVAILNRSINEVLHV